MDYQKISERENKKKQYEKDNTSNLINNNYKDNNHKDNS